jgi:hypothetical protein
MTQNNSNNNPTNKSFRQLEIMMNRIDDIKKPSTVTINNRHLALLFRGGCPLGDVHRNHITPTSKSPDGKTIRTQTEHAEVACSVAFIKRLILRGEKPCNIKVV